MFMMQISVHMSVNICLQYLNGGSSHCSCMFLFVNIWKYTLTDENPVWTNNQIETIFYVLVDDSNVYSGCVYVVILNYRLDMN